MSLLEFSNIVAPIVANVRCGHTYPFVSYLNEKTRLLPLDIRIINDRLYIERNLSGLPAPEAGSEITAINGMDVKDLLQKLRNNEASDGFVTTTKDRHIEKSFKWHYAMYIGEPESFGLIVDRPGSNGVENLIIPSMSDAEMGKQSSETEVHQKPLFFTVDSEKGVAFLRINSFMAKQIRKREKQHFRKYIRQSFDELRKEGINNLIIDVRNNTGGMAYIPPYLYGYLGDKDFRFKEKLIFKHGYRFTYPEHLNRSRANDWFNRMLMKKVNDSTFQWTLHNNTRKRYPVRKDAFKGKVYLLVNGMTASGAAEFATLVHRFQRGLIVGEESGGDYNGINGYDRTYLHLPHSGTGVIIAGYRAVMPWNDQHFFGHGVPVDYTVTNTISDYINGRDPVLERAFQLVASHE